MRKYYYTEEQVISEALKILETRVHYNTGEKLECPRDTADFLRLSLAGQKRECFMVLFLNNRNALIQAEILFYGTIDGASVWPREIVRRSLELNAAALVLSHNHPSGCVEPSHADKQITERINAACKLLNIRVLDHVLVGDGFYSFAENGLI